MNWVERVRGCHVRLPSPRAHITAVRQAGILSGVLPQLYQGGTCSQRTRIRQPASLGASLVNQAAVLLHQVVDVVTVGVGEGGIGQHQQVFGVLLGAVREIV